MMITLVSCSDSKEESGDGVPEAMLQNVIDYGKKYVLTGDDYSAQTYYVFEANQTGYCEYYDVYENTDYPEYNRTFSGRVDFVWREASNGGIYLFETKITYHEGHTEGERIPLIRHPIYFSEEFFAYSADGSYGTTTVKYVKEGSALAEIGKQ